MQDSGWRGAGESGFNSRMSKLAVTAVPAFDDNYLWLVHAPADPRQVLVVDPGDAAAVEAALRAQGLVLAGILVTHHHGDHVGGVQALVAGAALLPNCMRVPLHLLLRSSRGDHAALCLPQAFLAAIRFLETCSGKPEAIEAEAVSQYLGEAGTQYLGTSQQYLGTVPANLLLPTERAGGSR